MCLFRVQPGHYVDDRRTHTCSAHNGPLVAQYINNGTLRPLAIASDKRSAAFPDVPTLAEAGIPNREVAFWMGAMVPAKTPNDIVETLRQQIAKIEALPVMRERLSSLGLEPIATSEPLNWPTTFSHNLASGPKWCAMRTSR